MNISCLLVHGDLLGCSWVGLAYPVLAVTSHYSQATAAQMTSESGGISLVPSKRSFK